MGVLEKGCRKIPFQIPKPSQEKQLSQIKEEPLMSHPQPGGMNVSHKFESIYFKTIGGKP